MVWIDGPRRWRPGLEAGEPQYDGLEAVLAKAPPLTVPAITLQGDADGAPHPDSRSYAKKFAGPYIHRVVAGGVGTTYRRRRLLRLPRQWPTSTAWPAPRSDSLRHAALRYPACRIPMLRLPFDFIFLTGSTAVGKVVMKAAAEHLTPVLLELGGQNPAIVDETANLADAAKKIVWGAMAWGGQWCTSPGYVAVRDSVADAFVTACKRAALELYGSDPKNNPDFSRIITSDAVKRLASLVDPATVVHGGEFDEAARYVAPTLLYPVAWTDRIMEAEVFGPILPIIRYARIDELIARIKALPKPLAGYIFSRDQPTIDRVLHSISFGGGAVNQTNVFLFIETMPYGGVGASGIGHYYGKHGFDALTHAQSVLMSPPDVAVDHLFPPYTEDKVKALAQWFDC